MASAAEVYVPEGGTSLLLLLFSVQTIRSSHATRNQGKDSNPFPQPRILHHVIILRRIQIRETEWETQ